MFELVEVLRWVVLGVVYCIGGLFVAEIVGGLVQNPLRWPMWGRALLWPLGVVLLIFDALVVSAIDEIKGDDE